MGSAGRKYKAGQINRSNVMAAEGLYDDGLNGIRWITEPELRVKDQAGTVCMQRSYTESWRSAREIPKPKSKLRGPMTNGLRASAPVIRSDLRVWRLFQP